MRDLLFFAAGFLVARYIVLKYQREAYLQKEQEVVNSIQNNVHDLLKELFPQAPDEEIGQVVVDVTTNAQIKEEKE